MVEHIDTDNRVFGRMRLIFCLFVFVYGQFDQALDSFAHNYL